MEKTLRESITNILGKFSELDYVHPEDVPNIDLYMDQVLTFMDSSLEKTKRSGNEKILTKTMINNYTKQGLLPPSDKKKYSPDHMLVIILIYYMKSFLSIDDIKNVLDPITQNYFGDKDEMTFNDIYKEIVATEKHEAKKLIRDVIDKYHIAAKTFDGVEEADAESLHRFALICMLSFDVYVKKKLIEDLIDED